MIAGDHLPAWSPALSDNAGLRGGTWQSVAGVLPGRVPVDLHWSLTGISLAGLQYKVRLSGQQNDPSVALTARAVVPFWPVSGQVAFSQAEGEIDLAPTYSVPREVPLRGRLLLADGAGIYDATRGEMLSLRGQASLAEGQFDGVDLGLTRVMLNVGDLGEWLAELRTTGPVMMLEARMRGSFASSEIALEGQIVAGESFPEGWQRALNQALVAAEGGWVLPQTLDLQRPGF
jgi:hypothetical protein